MWAYQITSPGSLTQVEVPEPSAAALWPGEILLRTVAGGICGSDVPKVRRVRRPAGAERAISSTVGVPLHEIVGDVLDSRHELVAVGTRVVGWASHSNGLAERVVTSGDQVIPVPTGSDPMVAVLAQPIACVDYALSRVPVAGRRVAVVGVGAIGALFGMLARSRGAIHVTGVDLVNRARLDRRFGFDEVIHAHSRDWSQALGTGNRPDLVIEAVGHQSGTLDDAVHAAAMGGTVLCFGIPDDAIYPVDMERIMRWNLTLVGGITHERAIHLRRAVEILVTRPWLSEMLITHQFSRSQIPEAFNIAQRWSAGRLKVVLDLVE